MSDDFRGADLHKFAPKTDRNCQFSSLAHIFQTFGKGPL